MAQNALDTLREYLDGLSLDEAEKKRAHELIKKAEKSCVKNDFLLKRIRKDKHIAINLLNKSLEEIQEKKETIEKVNNQLTTNLQELQRSYKEMEQFAYIASHDLKSPLRTISNFAQILKRRYSGKLDKEADEFIEFIVSGVFRMNTIISDLLKYSQVGNKETVFEMVSLNEILELVQFNLASAIRDSNAVILVEDLPRFHANRSALIQLFQNLIGNAIKFQVKSRPPIIRVSSESAEDCWLFHLSDNGVGMDDGYQDKAFLPFQRINNLDRPGTGIGLAICKKAVELHNGRIYYESVKNQGTTFHFTLCNPQEFCQKAAQSTTTSAHI
ncbi:MAG: ATP-binding protein [Bacteroidota bacterium]